MLEDRLKQLTVRIEEIEARNLRVEADKAWEKSWARRSVVFVFTYIVIVLFMYVSKISAPWLNATVPALAFVLSTLTVSFLKKKWLNRHK